MATYTKRVWALLRPQVNFGKMGIYLPRTTLSKQQLRCYHSARTSNRLLAIATTNGRMLGNNTHLLQNSGYLVCSVQPQRLSSSAVTQVIPPAPPIPEQLPDVSNILNSLGEPTLASMGLCNYTPAGFVQLCLETLHVSAGLPWFGAIIAGTLVLRTALIPLLVLAQKNAVKTHNYMPILQEANQRMLSAKAAGDYSEYARAVETINDIMYVKKFNPMHSLIVPFCQLPIFLSVFTGLRAMATLPVESMKTGGFMWMTDLTIPDPYFILPVITAGTLLVTLELGVDSQSSKSLPPMMRMFMRAMPFVILPFIANMPAAMCTYWCTANLFSLVMVRVMLIPSLRKFLNIGERVQHSEALVNKTKPGGFIKGFKKAIKEGKGQQTLKMRSRLDSDAFRKAGEGPIPKTYTYNPKLKKP